MDGKEVKGATPAQPAGHRLHLRTDECKAERARSFAGTYPKNWSHQSNGEGVMQSAPQGAADGAPKRRLYFSAAWCSGLFTQQHRGARRTLSIVWVYMQQMYAK